MSPSRQFQPQSLKAAALIVAIFLGMETGSED
jgi:hypothetical protein